MPIWGSWGTEGWVNYSEVEGSLNVYVLGEMFFCWCVRAVILMPISCGHSNAFQTSPQGSHFKLFFRGSHEIRKVMLSSGKLKRSLKPPQGQTIQGKRLLLVLENYQGQHGRNSAMFQQHLGHSAGDPKLHRHRPPRTHVSPRPRRREGHGKLR